MRGAAAIQPCGTESAASNPELGKLSPSRGLFEVAGLAHRGLGSPFARPSAPLECCRQSLTCAPSVLAHSASCSGPPRTRCRQPPFRRACRPWSARTSGPRAERSTAASGSRARFPPTPPAGRCDHRGSRGINVILPLRRGRRLHALQCEIVQRAAALMAYAVVIGPDVPIADHRGLTFYRRMQWRNVEGHRREAEYEQPHNSLQ